MAVIKIEEFRGDHNKLFLTTRTIAYKSSGVDVSTYWDFVKIAKARFKVANNKLRIGFGCVVGDDLYLSFRNIPNTNKKTYYVRVAYVIN